MRPSEYLRFLSIPQCPFGFGFTPQDWDHLGSPSGGVSCADAQQDACRNQKVNKHNKKRLCLSVACCLFFLFAQTLTVGLMMAEREPGSARRRRERRLHSWWRHEQQSVRAALVALLHHSRDVGPGTNHAPRRQTTAREAVERELFSLYEEEPCVSRPDRLAGVRPQERVQRHTVEQIVDAALGLLALDAPVPLLALVEEQKMQEDARIDQLEDRIFDEAPVSAADVAVWRLWASGGAKEAQDTEEEEAPEGFLRLWTSL